MLQSSEDFVFLEDTWKKRVSVTLNIQKYSFCWSLIFEILIIYQKNIWIYWLLYIR